MFLSSIRNFTTFVAHVLTSSYDAFSPSRPIYDTLLYFHISQHGLEFKVTFGQKLGFGRKKEFSFLLIHKVGTK